MGGALVGSTAHAHARIRKGETPKASASATAQEKRLGLPDPALTVPLPPRSYSIDLSGSHDS